MNHILLNYLAKFIGCFAEGKAAENAKTFKVSFFRFLGNQQKI